LRLGFHGANKSADELAFNFPRNRVNIVASTRKEGSGIVDVVNSGILDLNVDEPGRSQL
jgi:hypothetical protein